MTPLFHFIRYLERLYFCLQTFGTYQTDQCTKRIRDFGKTCLVFCMWLLQKNQRCRPTMRIFVSIRDYVVLFNVRFVLLESEEIWLQILRPPFPSCFLKGEKSNSRHSFSCACHTLIHLEVPLVMCLMYAAFKERSYNVRLGLRKQCIFGLANNEQLLLRYQRNGYSWQFLVAHNTPHIAL